MDEKFINTGLNQLVDTERIQQNIQFSVKLPSIPKQYKHLVSKFNNQEIEQKYKTENTMCDCCEGQEKDILQCPHFSDPGFVALYSQLPQRLELIDQLDSDQKDDIRYTLFVNIMHMLDDIPCDNQSSTQPNTENSYGVKNIKTVKNTGVLTNISNDKDNVKTFRYEPNILTSDIHENQIPLPVHQCHIYRDLQNWFPEEYDKYFQIGKYEQKIDTIETMQKEKENKCKKWLCSSIPKLAINLSFCSNILLLILKIICYGISLSMSILASMTDSATDVVCGLVIYLAVLMARKGIKKSEYQKALHSSSQFKVFYTRRYESLGQLSFSWIMVCLSIFLIYQSILQIIDYANGASEEIDFSAIPMSIIVFTILLKLFLAIFCFYVIRHYHESKDVIKAYATDHRNDVLSNSIGLIGASLCYYLKGNWKYADPIASIILSIYILTNWLSNALESIKNLAGAQVEQEEADEILLRIFQLTTSIYVTAIDQLNCYYSGNMIIVEMIIRLPDNLSLPASHQIVQDIQNEYEKLEKVERCYVHVECESAVNIL